RWWLIFLPKTTAARHNEPMSDRSAAPPAAAEEPWLQVSGSPHFSDFLAEMRISLAFTTYQAGKLFLVGRKPNGQLSAFERTFTRCMGLWGDGQTLWMSSLYQ